MKTGTAGKEKKEAFDYIIHIIQYLEYKYNLIIFISPRDFDILYRWWEKRIPLQIIKDSLTAVIERWAEKKKEVTSYSSFYYEVKKQFKSFMELGIGSTSSVADDEETGTNEEFSEIESFFQDFPNSLENLKSDFEDAFAAVKAKEKPDLEPLYDKLSDLFANDPDVNLKVEMFTRNIAPKLRKPEMIRRYRVNHLMNKYHIPDFSLY